MNIAFVINQTHKEDAAFTTTLLALRALQRGHSIFYIGLADFIYLDQGRAGAHARVVRPSGQQTDTKSLMEQLRSTEKERVLFKDLDVMLLRFDPVMDMITRPWAANMGLQFARLAKEMGVLVLNDPNTLIAADNKLYLENFPSEVRPRTLVTRNVADVVEFFDQRPEDKMILKPLKGSGGK